MKTLMFASFAAALVATAAVAEPSAEDWMRRDSIMNHAPLEHSKSQTGTRGAVHGAKTVGALRTETRGLAISSEDVRRQGGLVTAGAVRWMSGPEYIALNGSMKKQPKATDGRMHQDNDQGEWTSDRSNG